MCEHWPLGQISPREHSPASPLWCWGQQQSGHSSTGHSRSWIPFLVFTPFLSIQYLFLLGVTPSTLVSSCFYFLSLSCPALEIRTFLSSLTLILHSALKEESELWLGTRRTLWQGAEGTREQEQRGLIPPSWCYWIEKRGGNKLPPRGFCILAGACLCAPRRAWQLHCSDLISHLPKRLAVMKYGGSKVTGLFGIFLNLVCYSIYSHIHHCLFGEDFSTKFPLLPFFISIPKGSQFGASCQHIPSCCICQCLCGCWWAWSHVSRVTELAFFASTLRIISITTVKTSSVIPPLTGHNGSCRKHVFE